jgi:hypothetical protein
MLKSVARRGWWRREPLSLPFADQIERLVPLLERGPAGPSPALVAPARFVDAAIHHRLGPYVVEALGKGRIELPAGERRRLEESSARSMLHAAFLRHELGNVVAPLAESCGSPALLLKGPVLAETVYPDRRLRPYSDLDLLVPRERLEDAVRTLEALGYRMFEEFRPGYAARHGHDVHLQRWVAGRWVDIELHWRVGDDPLTAALTHARLGRGAASIDIDGAQVAAPAAHAHLLVLAVHLISDRERRLCWVNDVSLVGGALDDAAWSQAFALADELGLGWPLHRAFDYAHRHLGFDRARPSAAPPAPAWGPLRAVEELDLRASPHLGRLATLGWRDRASFLRAVLVPSRAGLAGTVGHGDPVGTWRLLGRHARQALAGVLPRRDLR